MIPKPVFLPLSLWSVVLGCLFVFHAQVFAQTTKPVIPRPAASAPLVSKVTSSKPTWAELTPMQQQTLKPLASSWVTLSEAHKRKWLEVSKNYPSLPPEGQATMHSRMSEWAALSPQQRAEARLNFAKTKELSKQLTAEEKKAKWETYQALSAEEKQKLAAKAPPRPTGAAPAVKPVAPQKLATLPARSVKPEAGIAPKSALTPAALAARPVDETVPAVASTPPTQN
jgi:hypothetical protein